MTVVSDSAGVVTMRKHKARNTPGHVMSTTIATFYLLATQLPSTLQFSTKP